MTDALLALVPDYGLTIVGSIVFLASLGLPLPSSVLVLTCGGLAATGDIALVPLVLVTLTAFIFGDQLMYTLGRFAGPGWVDRLRSGKRLAPVLERSERLHKKYGVLAVFMLSLIHI